MSFFCCGNSVQQGAKSIGIVQMIAATTISVYICGPMILDGTQYDYTSLSDTIVTVVIVLIVGSIQFSIGYVLYSGAMKLHVPRLNSWLVFTTLQLILATYKLVLGFTYDYHFDTDILVLKIVSLAIEFWFICVVHELRAQILEKKLCVVVYSQPKDQKEMEVETV